MENVQFTELVATLVKEEVAKLEPKPTQLMSIAEAAVQLGVSKPTIYSLIYRKELKALHVKKRIMVIRASVESFIQEGVKKF